MLKPYRQSIAATTTVELVPPSGSRGGGQLSYSILIKSASAFEIVSEGSTGGDGFEVDAGQWFNATLNDDERVFIHNPGGSTITVQVVEQGVSA